jgi:hypothetical protein
MSCGIVQLFIVTSKPVGRTLVTVKVSIGKLLQIYTRSRVIDGFSNGGPAIDYHRSRCKDAPPLYIQQHYTQGPWSSTWGTRTAAGKLRHFTGYAQTFYINQNKTQEPLEPWTSSNARTHEDSSPNWGAGMPETSSIILLKGHNQFNHLIKRS